jgi:predicted MFS family arabinose efflux permease
VLNVSMNVRAVEVQTAYGRPIISSFHAVYSAGGFLGAGVGGAFAFAGAGVPATFAAVGVACLCLLTWADRWAGPPAQTAAADPVPAPASSGGTGGIALLGVLVFCCLVGEGAAADWSAVYLRDNLGSSAGFAAVAYAAFSVAMMVGRLFGDRLVAAVGPVRLVRGSGLLAAIGLGAALLVGHPVAGVIGFGLLGAGLAGIAPQVFSAAGSRDPGRAGRAIARVAGLGFLGFVVGPVVIGALATVVGLPAALAVPAVLALFVAACAAVLRPRPQNVGPQNAV